MPVFAISRLCIQSSSDLIDAERHKTELILHYPKYRKYDATYEMIGAPLLVRPGGLANPNGSVPFEVDWVIVGENYSAAADYFDSGERYNAPQLKDFALELGDQVARQIWLTSANGLAFAAPYGWYSDEARKYIYPGYSQALSVWDLLNAIKPLDTL